MLKEFIMTEEDAKNALLGTILADGHITQARKSSYVKKTYFEVSHTSRNLDYLKAKKELLERVSGITCKITEHNKKALEKEYVLFRLSTNSVEWLVNVRDKVYKNKIKTFPKEFIDEFTSLSLLLLYLDDGTLKVRFYEGTDRIREVRVTLCLDAFTLDEVRCFQDYLLNTWELETRYYRHVKTMPLNRGFRLWMNSTNTKKFMGIIDKYYDAIPSMRYKFLRYYSL